MTVKDFCPQLVELITSTEVFGKSGRQVDLGGRSTVNNLRTLQRLLDVVKPSFTLETGLGPGASALLFASYHQAAGHGPATHVAIDPYQSHFLDSVGLLALERAGLSKFVSYRDAFSSRELPRLLEAEQKFGIIYIDGSHLFEDVFVDAYFGAQLLAPSSIMLLDDSTNVHVAKVIRFLRTNMRGHLAEVDLSPYRDAQSLRYKIAKQMGRLQLTAFRLVGDPVREWDAKLHTF